MAFTLTDLDALEKSIAQGALTVEYGDKKVTYRSLADMLQLRGMMRGELGINTGNSGRRYGDFSKGFSDNGNTDNYY